MNFNASLYCTGYRSSRDMSHVIDDVVCKNWIVYLVEYRKFNKNKNDTNKVS